MNSGCSLSWGSALSHLSYFQSRAGSYPVTFGPQGGVACLYPPKLSAFTPELIWDNHSHGICFVCNDILYLRYLLHQLIPVWCLYHLGNPALERRCLMFAQVREVLSSSLSARSPGEVRGWDMPRVALSHSDLSCSLPPCSCWWKLEQHLRALSW